MTPATPAATPSPTQAWVLPPTFGLKVSANASIVNPHTHAYESETGLRVVLLAEGDVSLRFDRQDFRLEANRRSGPQALIVNLKEAALFSRHCASTRAEKKVCMTISHEWLDAHGLSALDHHHALARFSQQHLANAQWQANAALAQGIQQLLADSPYTPLLSQLHRESVALSLLAGVLDDMSSPRRPAPPVPARLQQLKALLDSGEADHYSLAGLAQYCCMSSSTLQRQFRLHYQCSVFDYLRQQRLQRARSQLLRGHHSVTQVALDAGYNSPANFATAFKREFGITPKACRA